MIGVNALQTALYWLFDQVIKRVVEWVVYSFQLIRSFGDGAIHTLLGWAQTAFPALDWSTVQTYTDQINYFFPLSETVTLTTAFLGLWIGIWLYRAIKSWIPTVSGA